MSKNVGQQTDFGNIYFNQPSQILIPKSTAELATMLAQFHHQGIAVKIRNTGHAVNGQTLTSGVQINIGQIKQLHFDRDKLEVSVGCGNSWHQVLTELNLNEYCLPIFPNNPDQSLQIGGTAAVGGGGPYSSKHGGFWNHVLEITLVTMVGEIIICSREQNFELMQYALGGFGRIGVITEMKLKVIPSKSSVLSVALIYRNPQNQFKDLQLALEANEFEAVVGQTAMSANIVSAYLSKAYGILLMKELDEGSDFKAEIKNIRRRFHEGLLLNVFGGKANLGSDFDVGFKAQQLTKHGVVYYYPTSRKPNPTHIHHPWSDYVLKMGNYPEFVTQAKKLLRKYGLIDYLVRESIFHSLIDVSIFAAYTLRNMHPELNQEFPLSLDMAGEQHVIAPGILTAVPTAILSKNIELVNDLTQLAFELGGKRYLYGYHNLTPEQVEKQFGRETIERWQQLKDEHDPKHLLNIGVIEHLD